MLALHTAVSSQLLRQETSPKAACSWEVTVHHTVCDTWVPGPPQTARTSQGLISSRHHNVAVQMAFKSRRIGSALLSSVLPMNSLARCQPKTGAREQRTPGELLLWVRGDRDWQPALAKGVERAGMPLRVFLSLIGFLGFT